MLTLQRRHSNRCPDRKRGPHYVKCRGRCPLRVCGTAEDGRRVRLSLKTRDFQRAARRLIEMQDRATGRTRKTIEDAVQAFQAQHEEKAAETKRKYKRILGYMVTFCAQIEIRYVDQVTIETMDRYTLSRQRSKWAWIKEIEVLRQFFDFCRDRDWTIRNPANSLKRPRMQEANQVVPYTRNEIVKMIAACDQIGKTSYERRRARAMVLLMRYAGLRISDVVTLSRDHIRNNRLERRATKNKQWIRVELPPAVIETLEILPPPKGARQNNRRYFYKDEAKLRTLVKSAWRTLAAVFEQSGVNGAIPHRFRHTLASELLGKGGTLEEIAAILADSPVTIRRYYAKWTPEYQSRQDVLIRKIHGTDLAQTEEQASKC